MRQRSDSARELLIDAGLAAATFGISASILAANPLWSPSPRLVAWALVTAHTLPVAFRRQAPRASFLISLAAGGIYLALGWPMVGLGLAGLVMTYSLATYASRRDSLFGLAAVELVVVGAAFGKSDLSPDTVVGNLVIVAAAWILGDGARRRREVALDEQRRAARQAVADERLRIARELHDVVAHSMSVIAVQAGTGRMVIDDDVDHARRALVSIEETSKRALDEMRRLLGVLRAGDAVDGGDPAALAPVPTLEDLDRLVAHAVEGGTPVDVAVSGDRRTVPAGIQLAAYRLVQEALTNVRRHAPGSSARVRLSYEPEALVVDVENRLAPGSTAASASGAGGGHGLIGMRERISLYGGDFSAGPDGEGAFRVSARLPYEGGRR
ncbi:MAG: sensor histidine kinase [Acidimicrobiia bacterium]